MLTRGDGDGDGVADGVGDGVIDAVCDGVHDDVGEADGEPEIVGVTETAGVGVAETAEIVGVSEIVGVCVCADAPSATQSTTISRSSSAAIRETKRAAS